MFGFDSSTHLPTDRVIDRKTCFCLGDECVHLKADISIYYNYYKYYFIVLYRLLYLDSCKFREH